MFLLLSRVLHPLALAQCLVRARFGTWSADYRTFFLQRQPGQGPQMRWAVATESTQDLGVVHVSFSGIEIDSFRFEAAWPKARFCRGTHFMDKRFMLKAVDE